MQIIPSLLFGIAASLDAFLVGISYGIRKIHISNRQNLFISLVTLLGTCSSIIVGTWLAPLLPATVATLAGSIILILYGLYYIVKFMLLTLQKYLRKKQAPEISSTTAASEKNTVPSLSLSACIRLGFFLSLNNMGIGLSASIAGLPLCTAVFITLLCSISFLFLGNRLGCSRLLAFVEKAADPLSGLLLILLGICEIVF